MDVDVDVRGEGAARRVDDDDDDDVVMELAGALEEDGPGRAEAMKVLIGEGRRFGDAADEDMGPDVFVLVLVLVPRGTAFRESKRSMEWPAREARRRATLRYVIWLQPPRMKL